MCRVSIAFKSIAGLGSRLSRLGDPMFLMKGFRIQYLGSCVLSLAIGASARITTRYLAI